MATLNAGLWLPLADTQRCSSRNTAPHADLRAWQVVLLIRAPLLNHAIVTMRNYQITDQMMFRGGGLARSCTSLCVTNI